MCSCIPATSILFCVIKLSISIIDSPVVVPLILSVAAMIILFNLICMLFPLVLAFVGVVVVRVVLPLLLCVFWGSWAVAKVGCWVLC